MRHRAAVDALDRGFTLIELMIGMLILAIVLAALAPAFYGEMKAAGATDYRSTGNGLAVAALEQTRAFPYYEIGYSGTTDDPAVCQKASAPSWNTSAASYQPVENVPAGYSIFDDPNNNLPSSQTIDSVTYTITRCVYWVPSSTGKSAAYKQTWVGVAWTLHGVPWHVTQTSAIYPGGQGVYSGPEDNGSPPVANCVNQGAAPSVPSSLSAAPDGTDPTTMVDLTWSEGANDPASVLPLQYEVDYQSAGAGSWVFYQDTGVPGDSSNPFIVTGLIPGVTYSFKVLEIACDGTQSQAAAVTNVATSLTSPSTTTTTVPGTTTTTVPGATTTTTTSTTTTTIPKCVNSNFSVSPADATINSNGTITGSDKGIQFSVEVSSVCSVVAVKYNPAGDNASSASQVVDTFTGGTTNGTAVWTASAQTWASGNIHFELYIGGVDTGQSQQVQFSCNGNSNKC